MGKLISHFRKPVEGLHAAHYMLIMVVSLAITVMGTRFYLELTGYPQLGNSTFHFAHALWGGLLQMIAASMMLIYLDNWIFSISAVLAGMGMGLFVDEIGKFITQTNDYFFPLAAPIIYATVILGVFIYLFVRRNEVTDVRGNMYIALEEMKSLIDKRMNEQQYSHLVNRLQDIAGQSERDDLAILAQSLLQTITEDNLFAQIAVSSQPMGLIDRLQQLEILYFTRNIVRRTLIAFFLIFGTVALLEIIVLLSIVFDTRNLQSLVIIGIVQNDPLISSPYSFNWYIALMAVVGIVGVFYLMTLIAFFRQRDLRATQIGSIGLVLSLTIANTMSFYFNQFSVVLSSLLVFTILILLIRYRDRFLIEDEHVPQQ